MGTGTKPLFAIGPLHARYAGTDTGNANWLAERWLMLNGDGQAEVTSLAPSKSSPLDEQPMPPDDSDQSIVTDYDGVTRKFTLSGTFGGTPDEINKFIGKCELLLNGSQADEGAYRLIQRNTNQAPSRIYWNATTHDWAFGVAKVAPFPPAWNADATFGLSISIVISDFEYEYTTEEFNEISFSLSFMEGVTW